MATVNEGREWGGGKAILKVHNRGLCVFYGGWGMSDSMRITGLGTGCLGLSLALPLQPVELQAVTSPPSASTSPMLKGGNALPFP